MLRHTLSRAFPPESGTRPFGLISASSHAEDSRVKTEIGLQTKSSNHLSREPSSCSYTTPALSSPSTLNNTNSHANAPLARATVHATLAMRQPAPRRAPAIHGFSASRVFDLLPLRTDRVQNDVPLRRSLTRQWEVLVDLGVRHALGGRVALERAELAREVPLLTLERTWPACTSSVGSLASSRAYPRTRSWGHRLAAGRRGCRSKP